MYANGNTGQARDKGGWAKAMVYVNEDGTINRCYNSFLTGTASSTVPCGFSVLATDIGYYYLDFGFRIDDRFYSATVHSDSAGHFNALQAAAANTTVIEVNTYKVDGGFTRTNANFTVIVY